MQAQATPSQVLVFGPQHVAAKEKAATFQAFFEGQAVGLPRYASIPKRFGAKLIDSLIMMTLNGPIIVATIWLLFSGDPDFGDPVTMTRLNLAYAFLQLFGYSINVAYTTYFLGRYGATLGKLAMGIRVVHSNGEAISYKRALGRALAEILSALTLYIGYFMALFGKERAALHDFICDTRVVETHPPAPALMRCASCNAALPAEDADHCTSCGAAMMVMRFPAAKREASLPQPEQAEADQAACFYHPEHVATQTCAYSGRYLCDLCAVSFEDRHYSGQSLWELREKGRDARFLHERRLLDPLVMLLAVLPLFSFPPLLLITGPATFVLGFYAWQKPGRLLGGSGGQILLALALVLAQCVGWALLLFYVLPLYL